MRGTRAKELRRIVRGVYKELPEIKYEEKKVNKRVLVQTLEGPTPMISKTVVKMLGDCQRKRYKIMKNFYKRGLFADGY